MKTYHAKAGEVEREWLIVDAADQTVGRLATQISRLLRGKHKPTYTPNVDVGDFVVVINAEKVQLSGNKEQQKMYYRESRYPGNLKEIAYLDMLRDHPERVITLAVKGMMPKNRLGRQQMKKLKVYAGENHPHEAQSPRAIELEA